MIHGSTHTGAALDSTPDGGEGWYPYAAENIAEPSQKHGVYPPAFPIPPIPNSATPKMAARTGAIGPAPNPANNIYLGLEYYKQLVPNGELTLPGSVCPSCATPNLLGATQVAAFDYFLEWAGKNIPNPMVRSNCSTK